MKLDFFIQKREAGDFDKSEEFKCDSYSKSTIFIKKTKCIGKFKYVYVIEAQKKGIIFLDDYYSYDNIYISLSPILDKLYSLFDNSKPNTWDIAVKNCPTIKSLFSYDKNRHIYNSSHPDYTDIDIDDFGKSFIRAKRFRFLDYPTSYKISYPDQDYENKAFTILKDAAYSILKELKDFDITK